MYMVSGACQFRVQRFELGVRAYVGLRIGVWGSGRSRLKVSGCTVRPTLFNFADPP